jgi:hypothetical protein
MWIYTSTPHTPSWRSASLVKHRDNFTLLYSLTYVVNAGYLIFNPDSPCECLADEGIRFNHELIVKRKNVDWGVGNVTGRISSGRTNLRALRRGASIRGLLEKFQ